VALLAVGVAARPAAAHGFGQRYDLPVPLWLWVTAAAAAVVLSFVVIGLFVGGSRGPGDPRLNLLRWTIVSVVTGRGARRAARVVSVALLVLVVAAGVVGDQNPTRNLAPIMVWVIWWVGFAYVSALVGNLWAVVNPWAAIFDGIEALWRRVWGDSPSLGLAYSPHLGAWPAVALFGAFAWAELVYTGRALPAHLALMIVVYTLITWTGMLLFGRAAWLRHGDPFAAAFGLLARFAPLEAYVTDRAACQRCPSGCVDDEACVDCGDCFARAPTGARALNLRPYGAGLVRAGGVSVSMTAFVILLLSTITFDGFTATPAWAALEGALYGALAPLGGARLTVITTLGLVAFPVGFALVYALFAVWVARAAGGQLSPALVAGTFVLSLVPIAIAYHLAHYLSYLLIQGQLVIRLASDPFGFGWNLFGTARYRPDVGVVGARFAWYTAVVSIVIGHVVAVYVAHVVALRAFSTRRAAVRSQFPMLVLMVGYTIMSLWIIAQPIVESSPRG
jgi:ferredoxin